jgi:hypothetical protein
MRAFVATAFAIGTLILACSGHGSGGSRSSPGS